MAPSHNADMDAVVTDLVEYLVVQVPDERSLAALGPALDMLVSASTIRILDLAAVTTDELGGVHELDLASVAGLDTLKDLVAIPGSLLSGHDVRLAALALPPGAAALVLVTEDRWAAPLAAAAHGVGGRVVAGERLAARAVERALEGVTERGGR